MSPSGVERVAEAIFGVFLAFRLPPSELRRIWTAGSASDRGFGEEWVKVVVWMAHAVVLVLFGRLLLIWLSILQVGLLGLGCEKQFL